MNTFRHPGSARELGIVGTGRVARSLAALLDRNGCQISAVAGRSLQSAQAVVQLTSKGAAVEICDLPKRVRRVLIAVSDDAIEGVAGQLAEAGLHSSIVLHTAAAAGPEALVRLRNRQNSIGVLHPLQTIPTAEAGVDALPGATFAFAGDNAAVQWASLLIDAVGGKGLAIGAAQWPLYHAAAVFASNYQVALLDAALELMERVGLERRQSLDALSALVRASVENVLAAGPELALTGPIRRGDAQTVRRHRSALQECLPETNDLYKAAGLRTLLLARRCGLSSEAADAVAEAMTTPMDGRNA